MVVLFRFKCDQCGFEDDYFFTSSDRLGDDVRCIECGDTMSRVYTAPFIRPNGIRRENRKGIVETGTEEIKPAKQPDRYDKATEEIMQHIESNSEMELSKLHG